MVPTRTVNGQIARTMQAFFEQEITERTERGFTLR